MPSGNPGPTSGYFSPPFVFIYFVNILTGAGWFSEKWHKMLPWPFFLPKLRLFSCEKRTSFTCHLCTYAIFKTFFQSLTQSHKWRKVAQSCHPGLQTVKYFRFLQLLGSIKLTKNITIHAMSCLFGNQLKSYHPISWLDWISPPMTLQAKAIPLDHATRDFL
jgi:hypothetical protein